MRHEIWRLDSLSERRHHPLDDVSHEFTEKLWKHHNGSNLWSCEKRNDNVVAWRNKAKEKKGRCRKEAEKAFSTGNLNTFIIRAKKPEPPKKEKEAESENAQRGVENISFGAQRRSVIKSFLSVKVPLFNTVCHNFLHFFVSILKRFRITTVLSKDSFRWQIINPSIFKRRNFRKSTNYQR